MPKTRCGWAEGTFPLYEQYHDEEWGVPVHDDQKWFEFIVLDGAQAGLSWATVLKKREGYRKAFDNYDVAKIATYTDAKLEKLRQNPEIIRNRLKIESVRTNARAFLKVQEEFGSFDAYIWQFTGGKTIVNKWKKMSEVPATSPESDAMSKDLKKRGFTFVGSTICYAFMQAAGMVNDHTVDCFRYTQCKWYTGCMPQDCHINYVEFGATDISALKEFYGNVFGWTFTDYGPEYVEFNESGLTGGFTTQTQPSKGPLIVLYHSDLEAIEARVVEHGGTISQEIFSFPGGRRFHFTDPSGNELAVWCES